MTLSPRQMLILLALITGFAVAAYVVSQGEGDVSEVDMALWCGEAENLEGAGAIFTGTADDTTLDELEDLKLALFDVETIAPFDLWEHIAALADFSIIAKQQRVDLDWPEAFLAARENKESALDEAIAALDAGLSECGLRLG